MASTSLRLCALLCIVVTTSEFSDGLLNFSDWEFSDSLLRQLPLDPVKDNHVREVENAIFSEVEPTPLRENVRMIALSRSAVEGCLDLKFSDVRNMNAFKDFACGNNLIQRPALAHRYGGYQFGSWSSQLGDGRAHLLGEYINKLGDRWELQIKGSGRTPYSRHGDGRAVFRSSIREFLCSEAMHYLGVPTSRAVSLVVSDDEVMRDPLYNGTVIKEKTAVVLRLAQSWFRFGSFEILAQNKEIHLLAQLLDFVIENHFQNLIVPGSSNRYYELFSTVQSNTIDMITKWMSLGFAHGVCNTDNFSILSLTIDYGPFGFVDAYDPDYVPNMSDDAGMYSLSRQPSVAMFNLHKLFDALNPVLTDEQKLKVQYLLTSFDKRYRKALMEKFRLKLGLLGEQRDDHMLVASLLRIMQDVKGDYTMTFRQLSSLSLGQIEARAVPRWMWALVDLKSHKYFRNWMVTYHERLVRNYPQQSDELRLRNMRLVNPRYVLRTWMAESAIRKADKGDFSEIWKIHMTLQRPFEEQPPGEHSGYADKPPTWSNSLRVSCSS